MKPYRPSSDDERHAKATTRMFNTIAGRYDLLNRLMSGGLDMLWRRAMVRTITATQSAPVLDACAGTGDVSQLLRDAGARVTAVDAAEEMMRLGREKKDPDRAIFWCVGDCTALPFAPASFDAATMAFGIRNIADRVGALRELARVVRPGGQLLVLEAMPADSAVVRWFQRLYQRVAFPVLGRFVGANKGAYRYLVSTIEGFGSASAFEEELRQAGWVPRSRKWMVGSGVALFDARLPSN